MPIEQIIAAQLAAPVTLAPQATDAVGFVGCDIPLELLLATGRPAGHLPWVSEAATPGADRWLEPGFPFWCRSILEQWLAGAFDHLPAVIFSRSDDASQRLYYYVRELGHRGRLGGPTPLIFDLAQGTAGTSLTHSADSLRRLAATLDVDNDRLRQGIEAARHWYARLAELSAARSGHGPLFEQLGRAVLWNSPGDWLPTPGPAAAAAPARRILLAGSFPPDDWLHQAVEAAGCSIVAEAHAHSMARFGAAVTATLDADPATLIAARVRAHSWSPRAPLRRAEWLLAQVQAAAAIGVILWLTREDEALAWHVPAQRAALTEAAVPVLELSACDWRANAATCDRIRTFCGGLPDATT